MDTAFEIKPLADDEAPAILEMLSQADLPTEDLSARKLKAFPVAKADNGEILGAIGIEIIQNTGLLRSLVVHPHHRKSGVGRKLVEGMEDRARANRLVALYLLTTTAADFFQALGYAATPKESVPPDIKETEEFMALCPSSSVCLYKALSHNG